MKAAYVVWLLIGIVLLSAVGTYLFYQTYVVLAVKTLETDVVVSSVSGFNLNEDKLHFGLVMPGNSASRKVTLSYTHDARVRVTYSGDIKEYLSSSDNDFILSANTNKDINLVATIPPNTSMGNYTGTIVFTFLRP